MNKPRLSSSKSSKDVYIPKEEKSMRELYPDLNIASLMTVDSIDSNHHSHLHQVYLTNPLPKVEVKFLKSVPKASFSILKQVGIKRKFNDLLPFSKFSGFNSILY